VREKLMLVIVETMTRADSDADKDLTETSQLGKISENSSVKTIETMCFKC